MLKNLNIYVTPASLKLRKKIKAKRKRKCMFLSLPSFYTYLRAYLAPEMTRGVVDNLLNFILLPRRMKNNTYLAETVSQIKRNGQDVHKPRRPSGSERVGLSGP